MWPHLIAGVLYVHNCLPVASSAIHQAIPFEHLSGKQVLPLIHLRVLGCHAYYRIPNRGAKLNDCACPGILVGFCLRFGADSSPPQSFTAAQNPTDWQLWSAAISDETSGRMAQHVFDLVHPPAGAIVIPVHWVFTQQLGTDGDLESVR
jgi:hypothetical protein